MLRNLIGATLLALPLPALAQDGPGRVLDLLTGSCDAAPNAGVTPIAAPDAMVAVSADGKVVISTRAMADEQAQMVSVFVNRAELPGGRMTSCTLSIIQPHPGAFDALPDLMASRAGDILGADAVAVGGPVTAMGAGGGVARYWTTPDFPPSATLSLTMGGPAVTLNLNRYQPGN